MDQKNFTDISFLLEPDKDIPVSVGGPERAPQASRIEMSPSHVEVHEVVEHEPEKEVQDHVQVRQESIKIDEDLKKIGAQAPQQTNYPAYNKVKLPITDEKIVKGLKSPMNTSIRWLSEVCTYLLRKAHIRIKIAHGKAVRTFQQ